MDHEKRLKKIDQFKFIIRETPFNRQVILFDEHVLNFNTNHMHLMKLLFIQPFVIKAEDRNNYEYNINYIDKTAKSFFNENKRGWKQQYFF